MHGLQKASISTEASSEREDQYAALVNQMSSGFKVLSKARCSSEWLQDVVHNAYCWIEELEKEQGFDIAKEKLILLARGGYKVSNWILPGKIKISYDVPLKYYRVVLHELIQMAIEKDSYWDLSYFVEQVSVNMIDAVIDECLMLQEPLQSIMLNLRLYYRSSETEKIRKAFIEKGLTELAKYPKIDHEALWTALDVQKFIKFR
jgi:hypothetical protein